MNYKTWLIPQLKRLPALRDSVVNIPIEIKTLQLELESIKSASTDGVVVQGGDDNRTEARIIANVAERCELERNLEIAKRQIDSIETAMANMDGQLRRVLDVFFISKVASPVDELMDELGYEKSQIYRMRDKALIELGTRLYGIAEM